MVTDTRHWGTGSRRAALLPRLFAAAASLTLLVAHGLRAETLSPLYQEAPISMSGSPAGLPDARIPSGSDLFVEGLTDTGLITFSAAPAPGVRPAYLFQWADGVATPIVLPGGSRSPHWPLDLYWPQNVGVDRPISVNGNGDVVFSVDTADGSGPWATYWWSAANQSAIKVRLQDEPATGSMVFTQPGGVAPAINDQDEIALVGQVHNPNGPSGYGLFFLDQFPGADQVLRPVLLPGGTLPGIAGGAMPALTGEYLEPSLDDSGRIAFLAELQGSTGTSAFVWENGQTEPAVISGAALSSGARIAGVSSVSLNNADPSVLVTATTDRGPGNQYGLYRALDGAVTPVVEPGAVMPGGGTLETVQYTDTPGNSPLMAVSEANATGKRVFLATLADGGAAAYRLDPDSTLTPVLQTSPAPGDLTFVPGSRPCINDQGQIALSVRRPNSESAILELMPIQP